MRIINEVEFSEDDIKEYKKTIYMNIIKGWFRMSFSLGSTSPAESKGWAKNTNPLWVNGVALNTVNNNFMLTIL